MVIDYDIVCPATAVGTGQNEKDDQRCICQHHARL